LIKQYAEFGLPYPVVGFNLNTADAWAAGEGNLSGTWPTVWHHDLDTPASKKFVADFIAKHKKPPENHAWIEYVSLKMMAQAMNETKSTDSEKLIAYFEKESQFDILKARKAYSGRGIINWCRKPTHSRSSRRARPRISTTSWRSARPFRPRRAA